MSESDTTCPVCREDVFDIDVRCKNCGAALSSTGAQRMIGSVVLDHYEINDILGQGGMSVVYQGKHKITGQEVALKVLPPELAAYREVKSRFLEEGRALAQLDHPNIVHLYNFGDDGDCLVLAMQFVRGVTWERLIMEQERLSWRRSAQLTIDVSNALDYAHGRGIIHRDMKPSNVLIRDLDGAATVMDFGIAKMQSSSKLTATGQTMGTVRYMSPEQVRGKEVDVRTDIYSLAMTTYESLVGDTPFTGDTHFEIMTKHLSERPIPPSERGIDLPPAFEAVLMRAISKKPEDRQRDAGELKEQLEAVLAGVEPANVIGFGKTKNLNAPAGAPTGALPLNADDFDPIDNLIEADPVRSRRGLGTAAIAALVLAGGVTAFVLSQKTSKETVAAVPAPVAEIASDAAIATPAEILAGAYLLPGLSFQTDETFVADNLRVLSVAQTEAEDVRKLVLVARERYRAIGAELGWGQGKSAVPLNLVIVPPSALCNPQLYESGRVAAGCEEQQAWYRPRERSLYLVAPKKGSMQPLVSYWSAMAMCIHSTVSDCTDVIQSRLGK